MLKDLEEKLYEMWLRSLGLFSLKETEGTLQSTLKVPHKEKQRDRH